MCKALQTREGRSEILSGVSVSGAQRANPFAGADGTGHELPLPRLKLSRAPARRRGRVGARSEEGGLRCSSPQKTDPGDLGGRLRLRGERRGEEGKGEPGNGQPPHGPPMARMLRRAAAGRQLRPDLSSASLPPLAPPAPAAPVLPHRPRQPYLGIPSLAASLPSTKTCPKTCPGPPGL